MPVDLFTVDFSVLKTIKQDYSLPAMFISHYCLEFNEIEKIYSRCLTPALFSAFFFMEIHYVGTTENPFSKSIQMNTHNNYFLVKFSRKFS